LSSGMLRRVALVRNDVSEKTGASFIRVRIIGELGTTQAATSNRHTLRISSLRTFVGSTILTRATRRNIPEDTFLHSHRREKLKSCKIQDICIFFSVNPHITNYTKVC
jgi:hypothetical protein